jgi:hypothetical protein
MPVSQADFVRAKGYFLSLDAANSDANGNVTVIAVTIQGIVGCKSTLRRNSKMAYRVLASVNDLTAAALPDAWIVSPREDQVEHINIFPATRVCPLTGVYLPRICWGSGDAAWKQQRPGHRTLGSFLEFTRVVLVGTNFDSPAR